MSDHENHFVSFYGKHNISPVRQNLSDINLHYLRRQKLYRSLGLAPFCFKDKMVLEIGPGGGYNSLAYFQWGAHVEFVEPNPKAQNEIPQLLKSHGVQENQWKFALKGKIEDLNETTKYDLVIAEGFIPGLTNRGQVFKKASAILHSGGVLVVTCADDVSIIFDILKRIVAFKLIENISDFDKKVHILTEGFSSHLKSLKHASRLVEDWVIDTFLNTAWFGDFFSIEDCIVELAPEFDFQGSSPRIFTDYSWYKDVEYDQNESYIRQFQEKRHLLIMTGLKESLRKPEENKKLAQIALDIRTHLNELEKTPSSKNWDRMIDLVNALSEETADLEPQVLEAIQEALGLLKQKTLSAKQISDSKKLATAFGRSQQYVSLVKR